MACDFVGKLLSDKAALTEFCREVESRKAPRNIVSTLVTGIKNFIAKITGRNAMSRAAREMFGDQITAARNAITALQNTAREAGRRRDRPHERPGRKQNRRHGGRRGAVFTC